MRDELWRKKVFEDPHVDRKTIERCEAVGLHPLLNPMGDDHHTDAPFINQDDAIGDALAYFLGTLFADQDSNPRYWYYERTSVDEWRRVARALRVHGLHIADLPLILRARS